MTLEEEFEHETGKKALEHVVGHGEKAFASWEYQLWLENKVNQSQAGVCDLCGNTPNVIIVTEKGRFCQHHAKY